MGNLLSRPLLHVLESSLLRGAELWDRGMRYVERSLSRFLSVCLGPLFGYERPSVLLAQRACDENGMCYIPATTAEEKNRRRRRAAADRESAAKRRKRKMDELQRRKARAERAALGIAEEDGEVNKKRFSTDEARRTVPVQAVDPTPPSRISKDPPGKDRKPKASPPAADERYNTAAISREMQEKIPSLVANTPAAVGLKKKECKVGGGNKVTTAPSLTTAVVAPAATKSEPRAYATTVPPPLGEPIKAPPRITREEVGASPEKRKDKLWIMGNLAPASSTSPKRPTAAAPPLTSQTTDYAAIPFEAPSMAPVGKSSRSGGPRRPSGPPTKLLDLDSSSSTTTATVDPTTTTTGASRVLLQLPSNVASSVGGHVRRASGECQPVAYEVVASSSSVLPSAATTGSSTSAGGPAVFAPSANHPHIRTRKSSKTKVVKAEQEAQSVQSQEGENDRVDKPSTAAHGKEPSTSSGFRRLSHAIASAEPAALYAAKGTAIPTSSETASSVVAGPGPVPSLLPSPPVTLVQPKAKHGRLSLDSSEATLGRMNPGQREGTASTTSKADKRLSLQIPPTKAIPRASSPPSAASNNGPLGVLSKARASLDSLRLTQTIRPRLNSVTNGAVAAASAIGRAATPPVLSSLVGNTNGNASSTPSNPASPTSEDASGVTPIKSVAELADRACMSRWEAKGKERKVWRDEVNKIARERCIDNQRAAAAAAAASSYTVGNGGSGASSGAATPRSATPTGGFAATGRMASKDRDSVGPLAVAASSNANANANANVVYNTARQGLANLAVQNLGLASNAQSGAAKTSSAQSGAAKTSSAQSGAAKTSSGSEGTDMVLRRGSKDLVTGSTTTCVGATHDFQRGTASSSSSAPCTPVSATASNPERLARRKSNRERPPPISNNRLEGIEEASLGRNSRVSRRVGLGQGLGLGEPNLNQGGPNLVQPKAVRGLAGLA